MTTGARIRQAREAHEPRLSQEQLAHAAGVTLVTVSRWERGLNRPFPRQLPAIAEALGVEVEWLLQDEQAVPTPSVAEGPFESALRAWFLGEMQGHLQAAVRDALTRPVPVPVADDSSAVTA